MSIRAPLREAAGSMVKASTPEPFSTSRTSNWVARAGGLPAYIQHVAHDLMEKRGMDESRAIAMAVGIIKNWAHGHPSGGEKHVDATTVAAARKALAEWEAKRAKTAAKKVAESEQPGVLDYRAVRDAALTRVALLSESFGGQRGLVLLLEAEAHRKLKCPKCDTVQAASNKTCSNCGHDLADARKAKFASMQEAASGGFSPTLKRTAAADTELERHEVEHEGQTVGMVARSKSYDGKSDRWRARAVNGNPVSEHVGTKAVAIDALRKHLEDAPARVINLPSAGKFLVARPSSYGQTTYTEFPSESAARHAAGLPAQPTEPERSAQVEKLGEMLSMDLATLAGVDIPPLRRVQEARRRDPFV